MRVITRFGLGTAEDGCATPTVEVKLDKPFLDKPFITLERASEIFPWSDWATVRVLNVDGIGFISNIRLHLPTAWAHRYLQEPGPPNETTFFLDLTSGNGELNRELGGLAGNFVWMNPWLDRWAPERTECFEEQESAVRAFAERREQMVGGTGIACSLLLDIRRQPRVVKLLWFYVLTEDSHGPVFEKKFIET